MSGDRAGTRYWNSLWAAKTKSREVGRGVLGYVERRFAEYFDRAFRFAGDTRGRTLIEIGCGDSGWLPFFAKRWGFRVSGLDYSPLGCERSRSLNGSAGVDADIVCADLFAPPESVLGAFSIVVSMGVVEHFDDTAAALRALSRFAGPGGLVVTTIPNLAGLPGRIQKSINGPVYDIHVPLDADALRRAHEGAGLEVLDCRYLVGTNFGVLNLNGLDPTRLTTKLKQVVLLGLMALSRVIWIGERILPRMPATRLLSPYVACVARVTEPRSAIRDASG